MFDELERLRRIEDFCINSLSLQPGEFRDKLYWWLQAVGVPNTHSVVHYFDFAVRIPYFQARKITPTIAASFSELLKAKRSKGLIIEGSYAKAYSIYQEIEAEAFEKDFEPVEDILSPLSFKECINKLDADVVNILRIFSYGFSLAVFSDSNVPVARSSTEADENEVFMKPGEIYETEIADDVFNMSSKLLNILSQLMFARSLQTAIGEESKIIPAMKIFWEGAIILGNCEDYYVLFIPRGMFISDNDDEQLKELNFKKKLWQQTFSERYKYDFEN